MNTTEVDNSDGVFAFKLTSDDLQLVPFTAVGLSVVQVASPARTIVSGTALDGIV